MPARSFYFQLYAVFLKELACGELKYGRGRYDFEEGTLVFIAPSQVLTVEPHIKTFAPKGWALLFHPDLVARSGLATRMQAFGFFSYAVNKALHLSQKEREMVVDCFVKLQEELQREPDAHSQVLIASHLELLLNYCLRFYDRQFSTRVVENRSLIAKLEALLKDYFVSSELQHVGIPRVGFCAEALGLSPNYFGDLIKEETGMSAQAYIHTRVIEYAKEKLVHTQKTVSEIAYDLGFSYPQ